MSAFVPLLYLTLLRSGSPADRSGSAVPLVVYSVVLGVPIVELLPGPWRGSPGGVFAPWVTLSVSLKGSALTGLRGLFLSQSNGEARIEALHWHVPVPGMYVLAGDPLVNRRI